MYCVTLGPWIKDKGHYKDQENVTEPDIDLAMIKRSFCKVTVAKLMMTWRLEWRAHSEAQWTRLSRYVRKCIKSFILLINRTKNFYQFFFQIFWWFIMSGGLFANWLMQWMLRMAATVFWSCIIKAKSTLWLPIFCFPLFATSHSRFFCKASNWIESCCVDGLSFIFSMVGFARL